MRSAASGAAGDAIVDLAVPTGFAAGQLVFLHQTQGAGAGAWEMAQVLSIRGAQLTLTRPLTNTYSSLGANRAQAVVMPQYTTVTIAGGTLTAPAWDGATGGILAFVAAGAVSVLGGCRGRDQRVGNGARGHARVSSLDRAGEQGEGAAGFGVQSTADNSNGGGGGGGTGCDCCWAGAGGGGGHAAVGGGGSNGGVVCQPGGAGGAAVGSAAQTTMFFGGAGANGGADEDGYGSPGANGGGIVYVAALSITVTGAVRADGQTGRRTEHRGLRVGRRRRRRGARRRDLPVRADPRAEHRPRHGGGRRRRRRARQLRHARRRGRRRAHHAARRHDRHGHHDACVLRRALNRARGPHDEYRHTPGIEAVSRGVGVGPT